MDLEQLQKAIYDGIFHATPENIERASAYINSTEKLTAEEHLAIYRGSILGKLTIALTQIYPVCVKLVGDEFFDHMVAGYLEKYPSGSPDIGDFGGLLADYIAEFKPAKELVYLPDVARLEWVWHRAFNALNDVDMEGLLPLTELANLDEEKQGDIRFCLSPSAHIFSSDYPVHRIWEVNQDDYAEDKAVNLDDGGANLLVRRDPDFEMHIDLVSDDEYKFLTAVQEGKPFSTIADMDFNQPVTAIVPRCIQVGWLIGFKLPTND